MPRCSPVAGPPLWSFAVVLFAACAAGGVPAGTTPVVTRATDPAPAPPQPQRVGPWRGASVEPVSPDSPALPADTAPLERRLRNDLAMAADPAPVALELAALLAELEQHPDALAVVDTALARTDTPDLRVARAGLLRDLGRRHLAVAELRAVAAAHPAAALHPALLFELAELEWLEGDGERACAVLQALANEPANLMWCEANAPLRDALSREIASGSAPERVRIRDLFGNLRGAPLPTTRIAVLERLVAGDGVPADALVWVHDHAIAIAAGDPSPPVRATAVSLARLDPNVDAAFVAEALRDDATLVRRAAADRAARLPADVARDLLLPAMAVEGDETTFVREHDALRRATGAGVPLEVGDAGTPNGRERVVARWRAKDAGFP